MTEKRPASDCKVTVVSFVNKPTSVLRNQGNNFLPNGAQKLLW